MNNSLKIGILLQMINVVLLVFFAFYVLYSLIVNIFGNIIVICLIALYIILNFISIKLLIKGVYYEE
jgi:hypothetical protein